MLTTVLAVWGAVASTALVVVRILEYRRDRAAVRLRVDLVPTVLPAAHEASSEDGGQIRLSVTVTNAGRQPALITGVALMLPGKGYANIGAPTPGSPLRLSAGTSHVLTAGYGRLARDHGLQPFQAVVRVDYDVGRARTAWSHGVPTRLVRFGRLR
jgi:hypothetical protein